MCTIGSTISVRWRSGVSAIQVFLMYWSLLRSSWDFQKCPLHRWCLLLRHICEAGFHCTTYCVSNIALICMCWILINKTMVVKHTTKHKNKGAMGIKGTKSKYLGWCSIPIVSSTWHWVFHCYSFWMRQLARLHNVSPDLHNICPDLHSICLDANPTTVGIFDWSSHILVHLLNSYHSSHSHLWKRWWWNNLISTCVHLQFLSLHARTQRKSRSDVSL